MGTQVKRKAQVQKVGMDAKDEAETQALAKLIAGVSKTVLDEDAQKNKTIADKLNAKCIPTKQGKSWTHVAVHRVLSRATA